MEVELREKYRRTTGGYMSGAKDKAGAGSRRRSTKGGNAGKNKHKKDARNKKNIVERFGEKILLVNLSGQDYFCASTNVLLPRRGMVVRYKGEYYRDWEASARAASLLSAS